MRKIKLYEIGNEENFNWYIFDKKQEVFDILNKIFIMDFNLDLNPYREDLDKNGKINIEKYTDIHESEGNSKLRTDLFYGKNKIYFTLICSPNLRLKFNESLFKYVNMSKPIKIKKKPNKAK
jgi:hypothetical protein